MDFGLGCGYSAGAILREGAWEGWEFRVSVHAKNTELAFLIREINDLGEILKNIFMLPIYIAWLFMFIISTSTVAHSSESCPSLPFTVQKEKASVSLNVADLRGERAELYELLEKPIVKDMYYGIQMKSGLLAQLSNNAITMPDKGFWLSGNKEQHQKLTKFIVVDALESIDQLMFACGSFVDGVAGKLSLEFSKEEAKHLVMSLSDPVQARFIVFMLKSQSKYETPEQLRNNINSNVLDAFRTTVISKCKLAGIDALYCERFKIGPISF